MKEKVFKMMLRAFRIGFIGAMLYLTWTANWKAEAVALTRQISTLAIYSVGGVILLWLWPREVRSERERAGKGAQEILRREKEWRVDFILKYIQDIDNGIPILNEGVGEAQTLNNQDLANKYAELVGQWKNKKNELLQELDQLSR